MSTAPAAQDAIAARDLVDGEGAKNPRDVVVQALAATDPVLVGRVRARVRTYQAAPQVRHLYRSNFAHVVRDFSEDEVFRVVELLVDLGELHPDVGERVAQWPVHADVVGGQR